MGRKLYTYPEDELIIRDRKVFENCNFCLQVFSYKLKDHRRRKYKYCCTTCVRRYMNRINPATKHLLTTYKHGGSLNGKKTKVFRIWTTIKERIYNKNSRCYKYYGGKGLTLDPSWNDFKNFKSYIESLGYKEGCSIIRKDKSKGYWPDNIKIIEGKVTGSMYEYKGNHFTINQLLKFSSNNISREGLCKRLDKGMEVELALTKPLLRRNYAKSSAN